ncbi:MAG TPA: LAGLIDADG family homing endonuclease [Candidatus Binatia bacterium]|nr:LAGLIDADG family homing endonuclease [Candidatus Binatia bacterium]
MATEPVGREGAVTRDTSQRRGLTVVRRFVPDGINPYDTVEWEIRSAVISGESGETVFEQRDVEVPKTWSQLATNVVVSKYFRGPLGTPQRERSVRQLVGRVVDTIGEWGDAQGYFATPVDRRAFTDELTHLLLHQKVSFNSPVWFNMGVEPKPQCSACFILSVDDTMDSILDWYRKEGIIFKGGSGSGVNLSRLRSSRERLVGGGTASGPVSFMRAADASAGVIKSGGKTRRAAKMVVLNADHPDIEEFVRCKAEEERKAWALVAAGYDSSLDGPAYSSIFFQNANNSVRVTDDFMKAVLEDRSWSTRYVRSGEVCATLQARDLMRMIAEATWQCGDPGMQFDTTINDWHTCPNTGRINASNPCVTGDALVATADGWRRIDALVGTSARIIGADGQPHWVTRIIPTGRKPVFRLRTRAGFRLRLTADHRVLTKNRGDVAAAELVRGDRIMLEGAGFGRRALAERLALAIGVAVGDGCLTRTVHASGVQEIVTLTMARAEAGILGTIANEINEAMEMRAAAGGDGRGRASVAVRVSGSGSRLAFSGPETVALFRELAVLDEGSSGRRFTPAVFELDRPSAAAVLRGLFTADGCVANYGDESHYVALDSSSLELLHQVQLLLLDFGIKAKLYENGRGGMAEASLPDGRGGRKTYGVVEMHSLRVSRASRIVFEREIGFDPQSPKAAALAAVNAEVGSYVDELADDVDTIEPCGEEDVFDLTEPVTNHFVANGLVVHNCSEYMHLDDSACNLASLNLMHFGEAGGTFDVEGFRHAVDVVITAQDIVVDRSSYPTPEIAANAHAYRELGLGYANLGALLMSLGLPYDSDAGREYAGAVTAIMCGEAYRQSAAIAGALGPYAGYGTNRDPQIAIIDKHRAHAHKLDAARVPLDLLRAARETWDEALAAARVHGVRNSQVTVLAPTGTIAFMMDCDTTGVEPDIALVKYKKLVGGGLLKIVNNTVPRALKRLGYDAKDVQDIVEYIDEQETIEGAPALRPEHLAVFDCAFKPARGARTIHPLGHLRMMGAVQPFISGAISKTINVPESATVEDIEEAYIEAWRLGLKAVAIYRDGCKKTQPLNTARPVAAKAETAGAAATSAAAGAAGKPEPTRRRLPTDRQATCHKFDVAGHEGYLHVGFFEDGTPGEIFIKMAKEGSTISGLMDTIGVLTSMALQYGVPLEVLVSKFSHVRFEPSGFTKNADIPMAKSLIDYIFRFLGARFLAGEARAAVGLVEREPVASPPAVSAASEVRAHAGNPIGFVTSGDAAPVHAIAFSPQADAPSCPDCGALMVRNGTCYKCFNCGATSGCS